MTLSDKRFGAFNLYILDIQRTNNNNYNLIKKENKLLNESLAIKDFIILGNKNFKKK